MRHLSREDVAVRRLLRVARTVAVLGAGARRGAAVVEHLAGRGFDVVPVRTDRAEVAGRRSVARLADVGGRVDFVLVLARRTVEPAVVDEAVARGAEAMWFAQAAVDPAVARRIAAAGLLLIAGRDIGRDLRQAEQAPGEPRKLGVHVRRRKPRFEDDRRRLERGGWQPGGGGGSTGGGGGHAVMDEKKMVAGRPSPRRGPLRARRDR